jgi:MarR family transcriptional regulator, 2-MHQ and catechol-resistance regulon repressor
MDTNIRLMVVVQKLNMTFNSTMGKNISDLGLTTSEFIVLAHLNNKEKEKIQNLAKIAFVTSGTATYIVNKLINQGYVMKNQDDRDKRVFWISITDNGEKRYLAVFRKHMIYLNKVLGKFSEKEKLEFIEQVKYFGKHIEESEQ